MTTVMIRMGAGPRRLAGVGPTAAARLERAFLRRFPVVYLGLELENCANWNTRG